MKLFSIDIETTGLRPDEHQIIEFGAVFDDFSKPLVECPTFHCYLRQYEYVGQPYALNLNAKIFEILAKNEHPHIIDTFMLFSNFRCWAKECVGSDGKINVTGKNFASFDYRFLYELDNRFEDLFHHRVLDPSSMLATIDDEQLPGTGECKKRIGLSDEVHHTAIADALDVLRMVRGVWNVPH